MVFFRGMMNQQRSLPRRKMPMRTGGNFGGAFALNPSLSGLSTITQPRNTKQITQFGRPIYNQNGESYSEKTITEPIGGKFYNIPTVNADGNILNKEQAIQSVIGQDGKIIDPITGTPLQGYADLNDAVGAAKNRSQSINTSPANNMSFAQGMISNIIPEQDGAATGSQQISDPNIDGQRVLSDDEQATIDNAALQERLKGRYDAPGYTTTDKIAAIAGVLGDVFSAPGDRNKTAAIMQTIEARRAGDMQRQQARLADESHRSVVGSLIKNGVISKELAPAAMANPELLSSILELRAKDTSIGGVADIGLTTAQTEKTIAGTDLTRTQIEDIHTDNVFNENQFTRKNFQSDREYELAVKDEVNERTALDIRHRTLEENIRKNGVDEELARQKATLERSKYNEKKKEYKPDELKGAVFYNKANNAYTALDMIEKDGFSTVAFALSPQFLKSDKGRAYLAAKEEYITAVLRRESGAAIGDPEFERYNKIYFPRVGDSPKVIANKAAKRKVMLQNLALQTNGSYQDERYYVAPEKQTITDILSSEDQPL